MSYIGKNVWISYSYIKSYPKISEEACLFYAGLSQILYYVQKKQIKPTQIQECVEKSVFNKIFLDFTAIPLINPDLSGKRYSRLQKFIMNLEALVLRVDNPKYSNEEILAGIKANAENISNAISDQKIDLENPSEIILRQIEKAFQDFPLVNDAPNESCIDNSNSFPIEDFYPIVFSISKESVERGDISEIRHSLEIIIQNREKIVALKEKMEITFLGYDDDPRELYEIPEVRSFLEKLNDFFPYWLFFLSKEFFGLQCIFLSLIPPVYTINIQDGSYSSVVDRILLKRWLPGLGDMCTLAGLPEIEVERITNESLEYLAKGPKKRMAA